MKYRPDVDGLRAIAILLVLFFHGGLKLFPSGFIGVDIFFVISGFLITSILHQSIQNQRFSFIEFYSRRLWRLQPVFIALLVVATCLALYFYLPEDLVQYAKSARKTSLWLSNSYFARVTTGYFASTSNQLPLLHTWSLSIEWQCYLILPIVIYILQQIFTEQRLRLVLYGLTILFFALSWYYSVNYAEKTYYQFLSRIFEFLVGACVAFSPSRFTLNRYFLELAGVCSLLVLIYIATRSNVNLGFPNWYALGLCLATATLIATGQYNSKVLVTRCLSLRPLVFIGLISYSLYIWHWPLFALIRYLGLQETPTLLTLTFAACFLLAYLSWRFIEKPTRQFNKINFRYTLILLLICPIVLTHLNDSLTKKHAGFPHRFNDEVVRIFDLLKQYDITERALCLGEHGISLERCTLGSHSSTSKKGIMVGDSFSNHSWQFMDVLAKEVDLSIVAQSTPGCLALPGILLYDWSTYRNIVYKECEEQTKRYFKMIKANHYDYVILGQSWGGYLGANIINQLNDDRSLELSKKRITEALDNALQIITDSGSIPVIIKAIASTDNNLSDCFFKSIKRRKRYIPEQCDFTLKTDSDVWLNDLFATMRKKYAQLIIIDPRKVQCKKGRCKADIDGIPVFRDTAHITDYASYQFAKRYLQHYKNPLMSTT